MIEQDAPPQLDVLVGNLHPNDVGAHFMKSYLALMIYDKQSGNRIGQVADVRCGSMGLPDGRNDLCRQLLKSDCQWLLMIDSDMGFEPIVLDQLLSVADPAERPIVGALCFSHRELVPDGMNGMRCQPMPVLLDWKVEEGDPAGRFIGRTHYPANSLIRTGATGGAMLLIHRSVIEAVEAEFGEAWFNRERDWSGAWQGEDISFFCRTGALGIPLHVHTGIRTTHMKWLWVAETDFWQSFLAPPATERVDIIVPALHRPQNLERFMTSLRASTGLATAWFVCDEGDRGEIDAALEAGAEVITVPRGDRPGTFAEKVNTAYTYIAELGGTPAPWIFICGDDVRFRAGWLDQAQDVARRYGGQVIGTNDLANERVARGEHATHMLIRRSYVDELGASFDGPGLVCHEGYHHWFVDDEIVKAAQLRGVFQAALGSYVEHMHPIAGKGEMDAVYEAGLRHTEVDRRLFERRFKAHTVTDERLRMVTADRPPLELVDS